jgi:hypothetical protein
MNTKIHNELQNIIKTSPQLLCNNSALRQTINGVFNVDIHDANCNDINGLVEKIDDAVLASYFSTVWQPETKKYKYSGLSIIDEVNALNPENVLDLGCGYNEFKGKIKNLTGVDPYNDRADIKISTLDFISDVKYDVTICLGSINFGSTDKIFAELEKAVSLTKEGGLLIFRVNPGVQHTAKESKWIDFYDWNPNFIMNVASSLNCNVLQLRQDSNNRYYFVLEKNKQ